jgi:hypothetical protein
VAGAGERRREASGGTLPPTHPCHFGGDDNDNADPGSSRKKIICSSTANQLIYNTTHI